MPKVLVFFALLLISLTACQLRVDDEMRGRDVEESPVVINVPGANEEVSSPLSVEGEAPGNWFFEARAQLRLLDENGEVLATAAATTTDDWMTEEKISFNGILEFEMPQEEQDGTLVFANANPSGLPENEMTFEWPVVLSAASEAEAGFFQDWRSLTLEEHGLKFELPEALELRDNGDGVAYIYQGATQSSGTELYDGISISFYFNDLEVGQDLESYVDAQYEEDKNSPVGSGVSAEIEQLDLEGLEGQEVFHYTYTSLGTIEKYFFAGESGEVVLITVLKPDPENLGYAEAVWRFLNSLELA